jgi:4-hydroxybenzoate polyprenyltransferase
LYLGGREASAALMILTWLYNDLGAGDENFFVRHINNALGFVSFGAGASQVACGFPDHTLNEDAYLWLGVIAAVITCTIQFQDMEDQEGDSLRNRKTLPIVCGDNLTRRGNAVVILLFSILVPAFWRMGLAGYFLPVLLGTVIAGRTLFLKTLASDKQTFRLWCLWLTSLYCLPVFKHQIALL